MKRAAMTMNVLEKAVSDLAGALENLESKLDDRLDTQAADLDVISAARRQAAAAQKHTSDAGKGLSAAISDVKELLDSTPKKKG